MIDHWDNQGVPTELLHGVERALAAIPAIIDAELASGAVLAVGLREEVGRFLLPPSEWVAQGFADRAVPEDPATP